MTEHVASRTLVKSPPELWAECSDAGSLARHLDQFGDIKITRLEPETAVAWEGERASGTVRLEPSGWGTRVTFTAGVEEVAEPVAVVAEPEPVVVVAEPEPAPVAPPSPPTPPPVPAPVTAVPARRGLFARLFGRRWERPEPVVVAEPGPEVVAVVEEPEPVAVVAEPEPVAVVEEPVVAEEPLDAEGALTAALDSLGQAHHRPFSRS